MVKIWRYLPNQVKKGNFTSKWWSPPLRNNIIMMIQAIKVTQLSNPINTFYYRKVSTLCKDLGLKEKVFRNYMYRNGKNPKLDSFYYKSYWFSPIEVK